MRWAALRAALSVVTPAMTLAGCIVDTEQPCDRGRIELNGSITGCICAPGNVPSADNRACVPCAGENEEARNGTCECKAGFQRLTGSCVETPEAGAPEDSEAGGPLAPPSGQGTACMSQGECASFAADFCLPFPGGRTCTVRNCANGQQTCSSDLVCCDVSGANAIFPDLMLAKGVCVSSATCAMGGTVVTP